MFKKSKTSLANSRDLFSRVTFHLPRSLFRLTMTYIFLSNFLSFPFTYVPFLAFSSHVTIQMCFSIYHLHHHARLHTHMYNIHTETKRQVRIFLSLLFFSHFFPLFFFSENSHPPTFLFPPFVPKFSYFR